MDFWDADLYRDITRLARTTPTWVQHAPATWTEAGPLLFAALFVLVWWRARRDTTRAFTIAALAPLATAVAYVISEVLKSGFPEERPRRAVTWAAPSISDCPPPGDWSWAILPDEGMRASSDPPVRWFAGPRPARAPVRSCVRPTGPGPR